MKDCLIEIKSLSKFFGSSQRAPALKHINLSIPRGCIYGIIGMSGAGKSTLLRCLTGLETPSEGSIWLEGENLTQKSGTELCQIRQRMGMVFQHFQLFSSRTVGENIAYPLEIQGMPMAQQQKRVDELLGLIGLESKKHMYPSQLSGGEKQRVGIARALANHPRLLLCDEPTSALDPKTTRSILQFLANLNQELGLTIVIITHQLETVKQICQRVAVLSQGEIVEEGEVQEVFTRPKHPLTRNLLHLGIDQIPEDLLARRDATKQLVRLGFEGHQAKEPVLSHMIKRYAIEANILSGGLDYLQNTIVGNLFVELSGSAEAIEDALAFLRNQHVICEVIP
ncbi:methionine ABC transporter ATP-binding protein [Candidatus Protochlamydia phocaeensis]|uniref:methionine ABC transporter ATP-binding protein n=1 Tax=Candidatus Protochlamydia phocaeensis TaxID=1414722 RepID=UPI0008394815|nr:ATP-binding cassette domain-containing protein [Candidatus Protochlamydia phocaeensis]